MGAYWGGLALLSVLGGAAFLVFYFAEKDAMVVPNGLGTEFLEPGSGLWMPVHFTLWYAMSDTGSVYSVAGYPWWQLDGALRATRDNTEFLAEYQLNASDVIVPAWRPATSDWDDMSCCNLLCSVNLHAFWRANDAAALEYR